jgi:hypothetical protein
MSNQSVRYGKLCVRMHSVVGGKLGVRKQFTIKPVVGRLQVRSRFGSRMRFTNLAYACSQQSQRAYANPITRHQVASTIRYKRKMRRRVALLMWTLLADPTHPLPSNVRTNHQQHRQLFLYSAVPTSSVSVKTLRWRSRLFAYRMFSKNALLPSCLTPKVMPFAFCFAFPTSRLRVTNVT